MASVAIAEAMAELDLEVTFQEFEFLGYESEEPELEVDGEVVAAGPCPFASAAVLEGELVLVGTYADDSMSFPVFTIEANTGERRGRIFGGPWQCGAIPFSSIYGPMLVGPAVTVSAEDGVRLQEATGARARLRIGGRLHPGARDRNVLGMLPGRSDETVVVGSHFDTAWRAPGFSDNASGVEGILQIVERLRHASRRRSVLACAFAAEELGLLGSRYFVTERRICGTLDAIVGMVNLDAIGAGERLEATVASDELEGRTLAYAAELGVVERQSLITRRPFPITDDFNFALHGIPSVGLIDFPYPQYHSPGETIDVIDARRLADAVALGARLVESQLEIPVERRGGGLTRRRIEPASAQRG